MDHIRPTSLLIFLPNFFHLGRSLPINAHSDLGDEVNIIVLGLFIIMGMGAILVACVRCRRKKRGFEQNQVKDAKEFKNEQPTAATTTVEAIRSEFPIFQALSTPSSPQFQQFENESSKDSRDNLTLDRFELLNETPARRELFLDLKDQEEIVPQSVVPLQSCPESNDQILGYTEFTQVIDRSTGLKSISHDDSVDDKDTDQIVESVINTFEVDKITVSTEIPKNVLNDEMWNESVVENPLLDFGIDDPIANKVVLESDKNYEISVEEALRELDIAIGEDDDVFGEEDCEPEPTIESQNEDFENVLRQLIADNLNLPSNFVAQEIGELDAKVTQDHNQNRSEFELEEIRLEATRFVDSLLAECCDRVNKMNERIPIEHELEKVPTKENLDLGEELFFKNIPNICHSTPSCANKTMVFNIDVKENDTISSTAKQKLFSDETVVLNEDKVITDTTFEVYNLTNGCQLLNDKTIDITQTENAPTYLEVKENRTITPVNTPIEVNHDGDKEVTDQIELKPEEFFFNNTFDYDQPSTSKSGGWFLHPQAPTDATFDADDFPPPPPQEDLEYYDDDDDEDDDYNSYRNKIGNLDSTFDALRKQLAEALPHAQGGMNDYEYGDDEENNLDKENAYQKGVQLNMLGSIFSGVGDPMTQVINNEVVTNYRRPLSPIREESEEETATMKTFVLNETKNLDSTSTGMETLGEAAIMGVTKTLMASNDTLFNFEDTLGDRDDIVTTPTRNTPSTQIASSPSISEKKGDEQDCTFVVEKLQPYSLPPLDLSMKAELVNVADITSPELQKTFSEDINSLEHISSDLDVDQDGTYNTTNTIEMETCISLNKEDEDDNDNLAEDECEGLGEIEKDERISEISEPDWMSSLDTRNTNNEPVNLGNFDCNSLCDVPDLTIESSGDNTVILAENTILDKIETGNCFQNPIINGSKHNGDVCDSFIEQEKAFNNAWNNVKVFSAKMSSTNVQEVVVVDEDESCANENVNETEKTFTSFNGNRPDVDIGNHSYLSGEEDPWASPVMNGNGVEGGAEMVTVFSSEWNDEEEENEDDNDSDQNAEEINEEDDESNDESSEEFMYVKGFSKPELANGHNNSKHEGLVPTIPENISEDNENEYVNRTWVSHVDQIPCGNQPASEIPSENKMTRGEEEEGNEESSASEEGEGEFIPSFWNQNAIPSRSAMKSPDKSSSEEESNESKIRRNVAFKTQRYQNVYEYPREVVLSPAYSEPQVWDKNFPFNIHRTNDEMITTAENDIDGFMVSTTTRPFHNNSQFLAHQCNTWPSSEGEFSWSQHQDVLDGTVTYSEFREVPIVWPKKVIKDVDEDEPVPTQQSLIIEKETAADSGVGESAELLSEPLSFGDLCHTKDKLRLPILPGFELNAKKALDVDEKDVKNENDRPEEEEANNLILPTPSCTGSMDSLSSSSGSDQPIGFVPFGKAVTPQSSIEENSRNSGAISLSVPLDMTSSDNGTLDSGIETSKMETAAEDHRSSRISDSTDEDSGIENFTRIVK